MNKTLKTALAVVPFLLTVACSDPNKAPAEAAISAFTADVAKYAPDQVKAVKDAFGSAKLAAAKDDWAKALALSKDLAAQAQKAVADAKAKKEELERAAAAKLAEAKAAFEQAQAQLPGKIEELKKQIAALMKTKKLPKGLTKDDVTKGEQSVAAIETGWAKTAELGKTDVVAAAASSKDLMAQADAAAAALTPPAPAPAPAKKK